MNTTYKFKLKWIYWLQFQIHQKKTFITHVLLLTHNNIVDSSKTSLFFSLELAKHSTTEDMNRIIDTMWLVRYWDCRDYKIIIIRSINLVFRFDDQRKIRHVFSFVSSSNDFMSSNCYRRLDWILLFTMWNRIIIEIYYSYKCHFTCCSDCRWCKSVDDDPLN